MKSARSQRGKVSDVRGCIKNGAEAESTEVLERRCRIRELHESDDSEEGYA